MGMGVVVMETVLEKQVCYAWIERNKKGGEGSLRQGISA